MAAHETAKACVASAPSCAGADVLEGAAYGLGRTHEPLLAAAVAVARPGPVLELGAGYFSTPLLHEMCAAMGRELLSIDSDSAWIEQLASLRSDRHRLVAVNGWGEATALTEGVAWSVVFVDHAPADRRAVDVARLANATEFMVVHDSEHDLYRYEPAFARFSHRRDYKRMVPWTTVLSNVRPFPGGDSL